MAGGKKRSKRKTKKRSDEIVFKTDSVLNEQHLISPNLDDSDVLYTKSDLSNMQGEGWVSDLVDKVKTKVKKISDKIKTGATKIKNKISDLRDRVLFAKKKYNKKARKIIDKHGDFNIIEITIVRRPIQKTVAKILTALSLGRNRYEDYFHLALVCKLDNTATISLEKTDAVTFSDNFDMAGAETLKVNVPTSINFNEFNGATLKLMGEHDYFRYNAFSNNCQSFARAMLSANNLLTKQYETFIVQDTKTLLKRQSGFVEKFATFTTDIKAKFNDLIGRGVKGKQRGSGFNDKQKKKYAKLIAMFKKGKLIAPNGDPIESKHQARALADIVVSRS